MEEKWERMQSQKIWGRAVKLWRTYGEYMDKRLCPLLSMTWPWPSWTHSTCTYCLWTYTSRALDMGKQLTGTVLLTVLLLTNNRLWEIRVYTIHLYPLVNSLAFLLGSWKPSGIQRILLKLCQTQAIMNVGRRFVEKKRGWQEQEGDKVYLGWNS